MKDLLHVFGDFSTSLGIAYEHILGVQFLYWSTYRSIKALSYHELTLLKNNHDLSLNSNTELDKTYWAVFRGYCLGWVVGK